MEKISVEALVNAPLDKAWESYTKPEHVTKWNHASDDWHSPWGQNDLRAGGKFTYRMEAKDGSVGFDFGGTYDEVVLQKRIVYTMGDGRKAEVTFLPQDNGTNVEVMFDAETENPPEVQREGWQSILNNFKTYTEGL